LFQSLKGFHGLWNAAKQARVSGLSKRFVSIPKRVSWFVEHRKRGSEITTRRVSIPKRVSWFVEPGKFWHFAVGADLPEEFQSLKGFHGLWNLAKNLGITNAQVVSIPKRVSWFVERQKRRANPDPEQRFQSLKGFHGLWNAKTGHVANSRVGVGSFNP
jgi:hypothetical protein